MKKQIIVIHGGKTFDSHDQYISYLRNKIVSIDDFKPKKGWKDELQENLGEDFEVLMPKMPNRNNARYQEWNIWFGKIVPFIKEDAILIAQSLGGIFIARYFSNLPLAKKLKALILISAPFDKAVSESIADFKLPPSIKNCDKQFEKIYIIHSKDDTVVPFGEAAKYKNSFPGSEFMAFEDRGHFNQETFPELIELIKRI